ncbi:uncharacterized protein V1513DRAFT_439014 [Lipomyces chichibuensis]|uniref:uncharacterized protein n=1 Tax=Lipomyces chichibuensis TaxID=1546026 RepID=UPI0033437C95
MDYSSQSQNTQQRPPRAKRLDYHALNTGTDSEGDSDEGPRSRSRRRLEVSHTSTAFSDDIISPDESASQVLASGDADSHLSLRQSYEKYFGFVDEIDVYYIAMILDPRFKCELLNRNLRIKPLPLSSSNN